MNGPASAAGNASGIAANAVTGASMYSAYPPSKSTPVTLRWTHIAKSPRWHWAHTKQWPPCQPTPTRCPGRQALTLAPTASMCPATSCPGTRGYSSPGQRPSLTNTSLWHMPHASTFTRTCPGPGSGIARSTTSQSPPGVLICAVCIVVVMTAPLRDACRPGAAGVGIVRTRRSITVNLEDRLGKGLRRFLRQIVPDAARDHPVRIRARKFCGIRTGVRVRRPIGIPFQGDRGHGDAQSLSKPLFQGVVLRLAVSQTKAPAIVMNHDADMIRMVEGRRGPLERGRIEGPLGRGELPDEPGKVAPVVLVARPATLSGEIKLVPPFEFGLWWQRPLVALLAPDQIAAHGDQGLAALRPERGDDVGRPRAPIIPGEDRLVDVQRLHQGEDIDSEHRLLAVPGRCV